MLVSGIVITLAFIMTALTLSQLSTLERQAASEKPSPIAAEWRFLHDRLSTNLNTAITVDLKNSTFEDTTFPAIAATFRTIEAEKGYDVVIRLAGGGSYNHTEANTLVSGASYDAYTDDTGYRFTAAYDGTNDGILWLQPCRDSTGPAAGCISGVYVFVHMSDESSAMEESILFDVNRG